MDTRMITGCIYTNLWWCKIMETICKLYIEKWQYYSQTIAHL